LWDCRSPKRVYLKIEEENEEEKGQEKMRRRERNE